MLTVEELEVKLFEKELMSVPYYLSIDESLKEKRTGQRNIFKKFHASFAVDNSLQAQYVPRAWAEFMLHKLDIDIDGVESTFASDVRQLVYDYPDMHTADNLKFEFAIDVALKYLGEYYNVKLLYSLSSVQQTLEYNGAFVHHIKASAQPGAVDRSKELRSELQSEDAIEIDWSSRSLAYL